MEQSKTQALKDWQREFPPSTLILDHSFEAFGYRKFEPGKAPSAVVRSLPLEADPGESLWITRNGEWIVHLGAEGGPVVFQLEGSGSKAVWPSRPDWEYLGQSWDGLVQGARRAEVAWKLAQARPKPVKKLAWTDSRALSY